MIIENTDDKITLVKMDLPHSGFTRYPVSIDPSRKQILGNLCDLKSRERYRVKTTAYKLINNVKAGKQSKIDIQQLSYRLANLHFLIVFITDDLIKAAKANDSETIDRLLFCLP